jgi:cystathionine beta-lyase
MTTIPLGPLDLEIEHRMPGPTGGPTLRVRQRHDGRERLRFDCFAREGHWHLDPAGHDEITFLAPGIDALDWTLGELRRDLAGYLSRAGVDDSAVSAMSDEAGFAAALDRAERALRNPPSALDELDAAVLRQRRGEKWRTYPEDVLPLWVADMDFPVAEPIRRRIQHSLDVGDLGYPLHPRPTRLPELLAERARDRFDWQVEPRRVELITEVVQGLYVALEQFTEPGDGVIVQTPIYPPFLGAVREMKRTLLENPLRCDDDGFHVDLDDLGAKAAQGARAILLCNPHNPTGRVFRRDELEGIAAVAQAHDLLIVSDEIHADLVYPGARHLPMAALSEEVAARTITLTSASKAFNIAGLRCAVAVFGSPELRRRFLGFPRHLRGGLGSLGIEATREAWSHGGPWLAEVLAYLEANRDFTLDFLSREMPEVRAFSPEATYLLWVDCRALELAPDPYAYFLEEARVALSSGPDFGAPGEGFVRLNFATSRAILSEALERMVKALRTRTGGS